MNYPFNQPLNMNSQIRNILHWHIFPFVLERDASVHFTYTPKSTVWLFLALCRRVKHGYASISFLSLKHADVNASLPICLWFEMLWNSCPSMAKCGGSPFCTKEAKSSRTNGTSKKSPPDVLSTLLSQCFERNYSVQWHWSDLNPIKANLSYTGGWSLLGFIWRVPPRQFCQLRWSSGMISLAVLTVERLLHTCTIRFAQFNLWVFYIGGSVWGKTFIQLDALVG